MVLGLQQKCIVQHLCYDSNIVASTWARVFCDLYLGYDAIVPGTSATTVDCWHYFKHKWVTWAVLWSQMGCAACTLVARSYIGGTLAMTGYVVPILLSREVYSQTQSLHSVVNGISTGSRISQRWKHWSLANGISRVIDKVDQMYMK